MPLSVEAWSLNHWTAREVRTSLTLSFFGKEEISFHLIYLFVYLSVYIY